MKNATRFLVLLLVLGLMSFKGYKGAKEVNFKPGIYGSCLCIGSELNDAKTGVKLTLNDDNTFAYFDNTYYKRLIDVKGTWTTENGTIVLKDYKSSFSIHNKWRVDTDNTNCIKSRHGLEWRRLCYVKGCN